MRRIAMTARVVPALAAAVIGTAIAVPRATANPATAPSVTADTAAAPQSVTLLWIDAATGTVTNSWTGSPEEGAALRNASYPSSGTTDQTSQQSGTISPLIHRVYGCSDPTSYWVVRNYPPLVCFAYAGGISVYITSVYEVDSGNNVGYFRYVYGGVTRQVSLSRWTSAIFYNRVTVNYVRIY